ncbi:MAG: glycoside hydrolase family 2 protein, partial [Clostridia bacterium]|nr:glycoside hydrolase family 2 protein [Clostridia bacterium]
MRTILSMNSGWRFSKESAIPEIFPADWEQVSLPHTWNAVDGQDGGNDYWRGTACYVRKLSRPEAAPGSRIYLEINGAAMSAEVYLNGKKQTR